MYPKSEEVVFRNTPSLAINIVTILKHKQKVQERKNYI